MKNIPVCILCGGTGTRMKEETEFRPKPMVPVGGQPMVMHIMRYYAHFGFRKFILALGYKQEAFKEYFFHLDLVRSDVRIQYGQQPHMTYECQPLDWDVILADTGERTMKGARLKRVERYVGAETFCMTYGDAVSDVDLQALMEFHRGHGKMCTVTGIHPAPRFGEIHQQEGRVLSFTEKPENGQLVNGGFFVFNRRIFDYLTADEWCDLEVGPLEIVAQKGEMMVYEHRGWWGCMDTIKEMAELDVLWREGRAPWKVW